MGKWAVQVAVAVAIVVAVAEMESVSGGALKHYKVRLTNKLGRDEMCNAECTFKKKPLGTRCVDNETNMEWEIAVYGDEIFACSFYWQNKYIEDAQVFVQTQQGRYCSPDLVCSWEVRPDGVYFLHAAPPSAQRVLAWTE